ncbi:N-acetylglucosamine kinase [Pelobium manganitolerans]|uniref:N-acetylglucosamine kinase n=1 Tax=Pelobium manganitolerans TaxID=1842495 RepID=UPI003FA345E8
MLLVADGGSSKTDWILQPQNNQNPQKFATGGLNPFFWTEKEMIRSLNAFKPFNAVADQVSEIHFFGAGCSSPDRRELVSNALSHRFKNAFVAVESDSLGSAIACCKDKPGIVCTLGTESNVSFYNGEENFPSKLGLGYILGEEASGTYFGKILVTDFIYERAPKEILKAFDREYRLNKETVIRNLYQKPMPNYFLASFAEFLSICYDHPYIQNLLYRGFDEFVKTHILLYPDYKNYNCHFVGSIAFHFQEILKSVTDSYEINFGGVLEKPIDELFAWIKEKEGF